MDVGSWGDPYRCWLRNEVGATAFIVHIEHRVIHQRIIHDGGLEAS